MLKAVGGFMAPIEGEIRLKGARDRPAGPGPHDGVPGVRPAAAVEDGAAERDVPAAVLARSRAARRPSEQAMRYIDKVGLAKFADVYPAHAVGRHEAARRDRPRAGDGARHPADGRALRRARRADPPPDAGGAAAAVGGDPLHPAVRHPLDRGGDARSATASCCCRRIRARSSASSTATATTRSTRHRRASCPSASTTPLFADRDRGTRGADHG